MGGVGRGGVRSGHNRSTPHLTVSLLLMEEWRGEEEGVRQRRGEGDAGGGLVLQRLLKQVQELVVVHGLGLQVVLGDSKMHTIRGTVHVSLIRRQLF